MNNNALRTGLEGMGFRFPKFNFNSPATFLGHKGKLNKKEQTTYRFRDVRKNMHRKHGTDRRN